MAYLDHNATTPVDPRVLDAMMPYLGDCYANPSALYRRGRLARNALDAAREQVAALVGVQPQQVVFTSGGTEANNLALKGLLAPGDRLAFGAVEHASVLAPAQQLARHGVICRQIEVDEQGRVNVDALSAALRERPRLVSVMTANNETGVIQDVAVISALAKSAGALVHTDAVQAAGKMTLSFTELGVDMMTLSSHKLYGPKGVGALIVGSQLELTPLVAGGGQENGFRSGTENVAAIVGFGKAAELAVSELQSRRRHLLDLRTYLEQRLAALPEVVVFGDRTERLVNTLFFALPGIDGEALLMALDREGLDVASGSACDSQKHGPSHVLTAMGIEADLARCAIRVSLGNGNSRADIDKLVDELARQQRDLQSAQSLRWA